MNKLIIANWKMNPETEKEAVRLARAEDRKNIVIAPPFLFISSVKRVLKKASIAAQDVFGGNSRVTTGAFTGEVSAGQLKSLGVRYVIIGHSERRALGETDLHINEKIYTALRSGLKVILCVGEPLSIRRRGVPVAKQFVRSQLLRDLKRNKNKKIEMKNIVVAYEPLWAIGTGKSDAPSSAAEMISFIKSVLHSTFHVLHSTVLYGGSVNAKNARGFLEQNEIDGALVGGASLIINEFKKIITL